MRVKSAATNKTGEVLSLDARRYPSRDEHDLLIGQEYLVFGLSVVDGTVLMELVSEGGFLMPVPVSALEIVSGRPSMHWEARLGSDGIFRLWPRAFYSPFYHSDLAERVPDVIASFEEIRRSLEVEDRRSGLISF